MSNRVHHAQLVSRRTIARDTEEYLFHLHEEDLRFRPGQFVSVTVGEDADHNPVLRSYSIASSPPPPGGRPQELVLILRLIEDGVGSAFFNGLRPGAQARFTGPMGFFVNELQHDGDVVYGATGTGITPILPMLREVLQRDERGAVHLHWGLRGEADLFWQEELSALASQHPRLQVHLYLSQPSATWTGLRGRITAPLLAQLPALQRPVFYLCGNGHMIEELKAQLKLAGVDRKRQIRTEAFFD